jgi:hypothetical protein
MALTTITKATTPTTITATAITQIGMAATVPILSTVKKAISVVKSL